MRTTGSLRQWIFLSLIPGAWALTTCHPGGFIDPAARIRLIDPGYAKQDPLVRLVNMPTYTELEDSFNLTKDGKVQVYAVGELIYNLAEGPRQRFFKGDDITLFFKVPDDENSGTFSQKKFYLSWSEAKGRKGRATLEKEGILLEGSQYTDSINKRFRGINGGYRAEIKIPWRSLSNKFIPQKGAEIGFDIVIGDTDDEYGQKAAMAWSSGDPETSKGKISLSAPGKAVASDDPYRICALPGHIQVDSILDKAWASLPGYAVSNVIFGIVKDRYDLSACVKAIWDKDNLYLMLDIMDNNRRRIWQKNIRQMQTFLDYGWIENAKGGKIWEMNALDSKYAGGAFKNQYIDTLLSLKKGTYIVRYISDESHSYGNWNAAPPETPFYGIVVYQARK